MVGVGWVVIMDDWLGRGGPGGAVLGFLGGALLLLPIALTYGRLVQKIPDAGAEIAYTERVFPRSVSFAAGWMMVLAYAIVCPWEAVAIGNLLARISPAMNDIALYSVAGKVITLPRLIAGLGLTACIAYVNYRGIRTSGRFQDFTTLGLLACFAVFVVLGFARGSAGNVQPLFASSGPFISVLLVLQIVPYFMTGFESIPKASEEARPDLPAGIRHAVDRTADSRGRVALAVQDLQRQPRRGYALAIRAGTTWPRAPVARHGQSAVWNSLGCHPAHHCAYRRGGFPRGCVACPDHGGRIRGLGAWLVHRVSCFHRARAPQR